MRERETSPWLVGIDVGGTFTDIVLVRPGAEVRTFKVPSADRRGLAFLDSLEGLSALQGPDPLVSGEDLGLVAHATTVATNALIEAKGGKVGLITTSGFRDLLEIGRQRMPTLYDIMWVRPAPLVRRALRREITERVGASGKVETAVAAEEVHAILEDFRGAGVDVVAVALLNSYANDENERRVGEIAESAGFPVSLSSRVSNRIKEFERTSTTVVNAYLVPPVSAYLDGLEAVFERLGSEASVLVMQSSGGMTSLHEARERPAQIIESGPAAGVVGAMMLAADIGESEVLTLDMGGTTSKASIIEGGRHLEVDELDVGGDANQTGTALGHHGYVVAQPSVLVTEVGAGGGSIAWLDGAGALQVGPESAGAYPGPACYGKGGTSPTVTDAAVLLGFLDAQRLGKGEEGQISIEADQARRAIRETIADPAGLDVVDAAWGIFRIANARMGRAIRAVTVERGRDPRQFSMVVFGGAGPIHGAAIADEMGIDRLIVPVCPGVFSATGLLLSDASREVIRSDPRALTEVSGTWLREVLGALEAEASEDLRSSVGAEGALQVRRVVSVRYAGQAGALPIPLRDDEGQEPSIDGLRSDFEAEHLKTYGHVSLESSIEIDELRVRVSSGTSALTYADFAHHALDDQAAPTGHRAVYFGEAHGWVETRVISRRSLEEVDTRGPLIVAEPDTTIVVPPDWRARLDHLGNVLLERAVRGGPS